jgi:predicted nucleic acid-binding protein
MVALELLAASRDEEEFSELSDSLDALPQAPITAAACRAALAASRELRGSRSLPSPDYLIAAAAADRGFACCTRTATSTFSPPSSASRASDCLTDR